MTRLLTLSQVIVVLLGGSFEQLVVDLLASLRGASVSDGRGEGKDDDRVRFATQSFDDFSEVGFVFGRWDLEGAVGFRFLDVVDAAVEMDEGGPLADGPFIEVFQNARAVAAVGFGADDGGLAG